jgi:uncharacterized protein YdhG (YjbR/CyaY superfamily)
MPGRSTPTTIEAYIRACPAEVQPILKRIRSIIQDVAPAAKDTISYRMPAFMLDGVLIYFAAFKQHIGIYPPVSGDEKLLKELARYRGEKGNLKFPLDEPMPFGLITKVVKRRLKEQREKAAAKRKKK